MSLDERQAAFLLTRLCEISDELSRRVVVTDREARDYLLVGDVQRALIERSRALGISQANAFWLTEIKRLLG